MKRLAALTASKSKQRLLVAGGLLAAATAVMGFFYGPGNRLNWVQASKKVFVVLPPTLVTDAAVGSISWSPNGAYCLVESAPVQPATLETILTQTKPTAANPFPGRLGVQLQIWDRATNHVKSVWQTENALVQINDITWVPQSSTVYLTMMRPEGTTPEDSKTVFAVMSLDAATGQYSWVPGMDHLEQPPTLFASPTQPTVIAFFDDRPPKPLNLPQTPVVIGSNVVAAAPPIQAVSEGPTVQAPARPKLPPIPEGTEHIFDTYDNIWTLSAGGQVKHKIAASPIAGLFIWGKDGNAWYFITRDKQTKEPLFWVLKEDGSTQQQASMPDLYIPAKPTEPDLSVQSKAAVARQRKSHAGYHNVWLSAQQPAFHSDFLVSADAERPELAPTGDSIFYVEGGIAKIRSLVALNDDQKKALYEAARMEALSDAKQVGLALLMYSNDYDDILPNAGSIDMTDPYLKNSEMLDRFNYTPPGDLNTANMGSPAQTILGTVDGPGGQAVVYGDGHAVWHPNP